MTAHQASTKIRFILSSVVISCQLSATNTQEGDYPELKDIEIEFGDIKSDFGINGFVGNDILSKFSFTVNFSKHVIDMTLEQ